MKLIFMIIFTISSFSRGQDSICFSNKEVENIANHINKLEGQAIMQGELLKIYESQIFKYEALRTTDSLYIYNQSKKIDNLNDINLIKDKQYQNAKQDNINYFLYGTGAGILLTSILIIGVSR